MRLEECAQSRSLSAGKTTGRLFRGCQLKNDSPKQVKAKLLLADPNSSCFLIFVLQKTLFAWKGWEKSWFYWRRSPTKHPQDCQLILTAYKYIHTHMNTHTHMYTCMWTHTYKGNFLIGKKPFQKPELAPEQECDLTKLDLLSSPFY